MSSDCKKTLPLKPLVIALGAGTVISLSGTVLADQTNPFSTKQLESGYTILAERDSNRGSDRENKGRNSKRGEAKSAQGKCGNGKCGEDKDKDKEGTCGKDKDKEGTCGKDKEGSCGSNKDDEGKCGSGKCGS